jgi:hypothetical protein
MSTSELNGYSQQCCRYQTAAHQRATAPAPEAVLNEMFDYLISKLCAAESPRGALIKLILESEDTIDGALGAACQENGGDKLRFTREFVRARNLDEDEVLTWLADNYLSGDEERCDCLTLRLLASYVAGY